MFRLTKGRTARKLRQAVMLASGRALEGWAAGRARRDLHQLLERAPRVAHRRVGEALEPVPAALAVPFVVTASRRTSSALKIASATGS